MVEQKPFKEAENLEELEGDLVRIIRPHSKSRIIKVDDIRELEKAMFQAAEASKWKVGVVIDADRMQAAAANAFLKTLEEPPNGCLLLLLTHSPERLLPTILSRCVNITLMSSEDQRTPLEGEQEMLTTLLRVGKQGFSSVSRALSIKSVFSTLLNKRKLAISKDYEAAQKEEEKHYKNATDGEWLKEREKHFESLTQSDYLLERSKFIDSAYQADLSSVIETYKENGYRDARILSDSIIINDDQTISLKIDVNEGELYTFGNITFIGNTVYSNEYLSRFLRIKKGDTYNGVLLQKRIADDTKPDAFDITNEYQNNGYLFSNINPCFSWVLQVYRNS